jgi:hypothetical protein
MEHSKSLQTSGKRWELKTRKNHRKNIESYEIVWKDIFMPFDVICGLDGCPPDDYDDNNGKTHWWVFPKSIKGHNCEHSIARFILQLPTRQFKELDQAIAFCFEWRKGWLISELLK